MSGSYVQMPAENVRAMAQSIVDEIDEDREEAREILIGYCIDKAKRSWWRRMWRLPEPTRDQIVADLRRASPPCCSRMDLIAARYGHQRAVAERLVIASNHADMVMVSVDDLATVAR